MANRTHRRLLFVRHGATAPNLSGLRCGGDLDVPLEPLGRRQAVEAATRIRALGLPVGTIIASPLRRTLETAEIMAGLLQNSGVLVEPAFVERRMGAWNLRPIADTEHLLATGETPPGGESEAAFRARIADAVEALWPRLPALLVGSKGVARVLAGMLGHCPRDDVANGDLLEFDLAPPARHAEARCPHAAVSVECAA